MEAFSHALTYQIQQSINPYAMSSAAYSELIDYYNYNSPFSTPSVLSSGRYPPFQFSAPPSYYYPNTIIPPYGIPVNHGSPPAAFQVNHNVAFVDEVAVLSLEYSSIASPAAFPVAFVDEVPVMSLEYSNTASPAAFPVAFVDEVAVMSSEYSNIVGYEDLLEMEERMGRVNVGLSEETISKNLKTSTIARVDHSKEKEEDDQVEICVVCQSEFEGDETVATLHCGHCYHANCIKEWLLHKNVCPICKSTALEV